MITIRQAVYEDIPRIMQFIDEHWKKGHIMGNDRTMFEFQHVRGKEVFYIMAEDNTDGKIYGSMGYIPMSEGEWSYMSTVMIRSLKNPENRMLGDEMLQFFRENMKCQNVISVGVEERYAKLIALMGEDVIGKLRHYYRLGRKRDFKIAQIDHYDVLPIEKDGVELVSLDTIEDFKSQVVLDELDKDYPRRSLLYIEHRYYQHPYYVYKIWGLCGEDGIRSVVVTREEYMNGAKVLRIVDFLGRDRDLAYAGNSFDRILEKENYEYIDFYCYGIEAAILQAAGFMLRDETDRNIIPNYFDPFVKKNKDIYFYAWYNNGIHVYRGFGDQDRPNHVVKGMNKGVNKYVRKD